MTRDRRIGSASDWRPRARLSHEKDRYASEFSLPASGSRLGSSRISATFRTRPDVAESLSPRTGSAARRSERSESGSTNSPSSASMMLSRTGSVESSAPSSLAHGYSPRVRYLRANSTATSGHGNVSSWQYVWRRGGAKSMPIPRVRTNCCGRPDTVRHAGPQGGFMEGMQFFARIWRRHLLVVVAVGKV